MYHELIKKLNPLPVFNLKWYRDEDLYSDGDIEDVIIKLIAECEPEEYAEVIYENMSWPTYYHLTHLRKNILNWYPFEKESTILEIGCGMGAITNMLCEKCHDVTAVELSKKRAIATLLRCRKKENLEIIVGNLNDIQFEKKFDYITLIGVLEYQGTYTGTDNPYMKFLMEIKKLLKPNGKLLIGIENKYGLKYWCGAREDHTGIPFEGMNQYSITTKKVRTFSRKELELLIKDSGFKNSFFYYPMPDYKLPTVIYSQNKLPGNENMHNLQSYYIPDRNTLIAEEMDIYKDIIRNDVFEFFANSFLAECSDDEKLGKITFGCFSTERRKNYRIATVFTSKGTVEKIPLHESEGAAHIWQIVKNKIALEKTGKTVLPILLQGGKLVSEYVYEELLEDRILTAFDRRNKFDIYRILDKVYQEILTSSEQVNPEDNIFYKMEIDKSVDAKKYGPILRIGYIDMIFRNAFYVNGEIKWFDQEWILEYVPARYVFYRAVMSLYPLYPWVNKVIPITEIAQKYDLIPAWKEYDLLENLFSDMVLDPAHAAASQIYRSGDRNICLNNIQKLLFSEENTNMLPTSDNQFTEIEHKIQCRLYTATNIEKFGNTYYIVDCWHDRVIYAKDLSKIKDWNILDNNLYHPHSICEGNGIYAVENTENGSVCFYKKGTIFEKIDEISVGRRPHRLIYDNLRDMFWILAGESQEIFGVRMTDGILQICFRQKIEELKSSYVRSMRIINNKFYIVSGPGYILQLIFSNDRFIIEKMYPVPADYCGMNDIIFLDGYFWISVYQDSKKNIRPALLRLSSLEDFQTGKYQDFYDVLGIKGVPYFFSWIDEKICIPEIDLYNRIVLYDIKQGELKVNRVLYDFGTAKQEDIIYNNRKRLH